MSKRKILFLLVALIVIVGISWVLFGRKGTDEAARPVAGPVPVRIITASLSNIPVTLSGIGNIEALNHVVIRPQIDGELLRFHVREGDRVKKGQLLVEIDARTIRAELARAEAERNSNQAQLAIAEMDFTRYNNLLQDDAIARQRVEQQQALVQQLKAAVQVAQSAIDAANVRLSYTRMTSPLSGHVGITRIHPGNIVQASDPNGLVTVTQIDPVAVLFTLPQTALNDILPLMRQSDRPVEIMTRQGGAGADVILATGQLQTIDNQIDTTTGTIRLKAVIQNPDNALWPGQFVVARITPRVLEQKIALPLTAVLRGQGKTFVYRLQDDKVEAVDVTVIFEDDNRVVVDGLAAGDRIVIDGQLRIKPGSAVTVTGQGRGERLTPVDAPGAP